MISIKNAILSSVGRKVLMALSGILLILFVIIHLAGNFALFSSDGTAFNEYAHFLESLGKILILFELGLVALFLIHFLTAVILKWKNRQARPIAYQKVQSKGGPSRSNISSRHMIITGLVLFGFLVFHLWQFKYGYGVEEGYVVNGPSGAMRDLYRLVSEVFHNPINVGIYIAVMIFLWAHLRHGFWSAFQSLGAMNPRFSKPITLIGWTIAIFLAVGYLFIPIWFYFDIPGVLQ